MAKHKPQARQKRKKKSKSKTSDPNDIFTGKNISDRLDYARRLYYDKMAKRGTPVASYDYQCPHCWNDINRMSIAVEFEDTRFDAIETVRHMIICPHCDEAIHCEAVVDFVMRQRPKYI